MADIDPDLASLEPQALRDALRARADKSSSAATESLAADSPVARASDDELADALRHVQKAVYGVDDRLDVFQVSDPALLADADSTVALVRPSSITDNGDGTSTISGPTLGNAKNLCASEPFRDQPAIAFCTGFLVGDDVVATAGHCIQASSAANTRFVFGYQMQDATTATTTVPNSQIYEAAQVLDRSESASDWAVVRLDRSVPDHPPLPFRSSGKIPDGEAIHVIGHPSGLPRKIAGGSSVRDNSPSTHFVANLDTYGGNSGSPVFSSATHQVEGILVRGETDYVSVGSCNQSVVCPDTGCRGEDVTRATEFAATVPSGGGGGGATTPPPWPGNFFRFPPLTKGEDVRAWQVRMTTIGFPLDADGLYGQKSKTACMGLQQARSIQVDGIVGPDTWRETFA